MHDAGLSSAQRLDKFLFVARFFRTRVLAAEAVSHGAVRVNGKLAEKPGASVKPGDVLTLAQGSRIRVVAIKALELRRGGAAEASCLYEELP